MELADMIEIHQLIALYGHAADAPEENLLPLVFTEDGVWESKTDRFAHISSNRLEGREAIAGMFAMGVPPNSPAHHTSNIWVREEGGQVKVRSKWTAHPERGIYMGDYNDIVVRTPEGWRIKHRIVSFRYVEGEVAKD